MPWSFRRFILVWIGIATLASAVAQTAASPPASVVIDAVTASEVLQDGLQIQAGPTALRITALRDDIIRVRISPSPTLPEDASWAVLAESRSKTISVQPMQDQASVGFRTAALDVRVERNPLRIVI